MSFRAPGLAPAYPDPVKTTVAAILAGGRATRLGGIDKGALVLGGTSIVQRQLRLLRPLADRLLIVAGRRERYLGLGDAVVDDIQPGMGPIGGLLTALTLARPGWALVVACDLPFLDPAFLRHLVSLASAVDAVVPRTQDGLHPLCAAYGPGALEPVRRSVAAGRLKVTDLLGDLRVREVGPEEVMAFDPDGLLLHNVNTPEDYRRAVDRAAALAHRLTSG